MVGCFFVAELFKDSLMILYNNDWKFKAPGEDIFNEVTLPHSWNAEGWTYEADKPLEPQGTGVYEKHIDGNLYNGYTLKFEGVCAYCEVYINGVKVTENIGAHKPFIVDLELKDGDNVSGNRTKIKVVKNKIAAPFRTAEFDIMYNEGISKTGDILDLAVANDVIEKSGAFLKYNGETLGQGRENVKKLFVEKPELMAEIEQKVREKIMPETVKSTTAKSAAKPKDESEKPDKD